MGIYDLVKERYEREARETARRQAAEEARQRRERALRRDAARIATALAAGKVRHTAAHTSGWHLGTETGGGAPRDDGRGVVSVPYRHDWQLSESGGIYRNAELREKVLPRVEAWKAVVLGGVREALKTLDSCGVSLPPVFTADAIACFISEFWLGMEISNLLGSDPESGEHRRALDAMEQLLGRIDEIAREHGREPATPKRTTTSRHRRNK